MDELSNQKFREYTKKFVHCRPFKCKFECYDDSIILYISHVKTKAVVHRKLLKPIIKPMAKSAIVSMIEELK